MNGHSPDLAALVESLSSEVETLSEALDAAMLELALEDTEWRRLLAGAATEFSKAGIDKISELSRLMAIKNPLVKRGLAVQGAYTFGQGVAISARHPQLQPIIARFVAQNRDQLFGLQAQLMRDKELACDGNLFLALWTNPLTGAVQVRSIPLAEITEVVTDPDDRATVWYYRRSWVETTTNPATGTSETAARQVYYPSWRYRPRVQPATFGNLPIRWDAPVYHLAVGSFLDWTWGLSEVYAAIDWARAYKEFLEDWATITRALARFAWKRTTRGTKKAVSAAARQLATTLGVGQSETNPPPTVASTAVMGEGEGLEPMKTAGATTRMEDGRRLLLMVAAVMNLPETFFGDASVGSLATAHSLDRPTELAMQARQLLWRECYDDLTAYALLAAVRAAGRQTAPADVRALRPLAAMARADAASETVVWTIDPATNQPLDASVAQDWPPIVEIAPETEMQTITAAAPYLPDPQLRARLVLRALRVPDADAVLAQLFPEGATHVRPD